MFRKMRGHVQQLSVEECLDILNREIAVSLNTVSCLELNIEHMSGKQGKELLRKPH